MTTTRPVPAKKAVTVDVSVAAGRNAPVRAVLRLEDLLRDVRQGLAPAARGRRGAAAVAEVDPALLEALAALEQALRRQRARARRGGG
jgi:hypothetical protein